MLLAEDPEFLQKSHDLIKFYREYPEIAAEDLLNVDLSPIQQVVLRSMWFKNYTMSIMCRGAGKTFLLGVFAVLKALLYPGHRVGLLAPTFRQCVVGDTLVLTEEGVKYVDQLTERPNLLLSSEGFQNSSAFYKNLPEKTQRLETNRGFIIEGALDHRILTMSQTGDIVYTKLCDIQENDYVVLHKNSFPAREIKVDLTQYVGNLSLTGNTRDCFIPPILDEDLSYYLGLLSGDGCLTQENYVHFTNNDPGILEEYKRICSIYFESHHCQEKENGLQQITKGSKKFFTFLQKIGVANKYAYEKTIPPVILMSDKKHICSFIRGLFDTDGGCYFYPGSSHPYKISIGLTSERFIKELQTILLLFGIVSSRYANNSGRNKTLHCLEISDKSSVVCFSETIGFKSRHKYNTLQDILSYINTSNTFRSHSDIIPNIDLKIKNVCGKIRELKQGFGHLNLWKHIDKSGNIKPGHNITRSYLKQIIAYCDSNNINCEDLDQLKNIFKKDYLFEKIKQKQVGFNYTYDFTVDDVHNYFSNGFISHNSKMIFDEVTKLWQRSPIIQASSERKPTQQSDNCYLRFKAVGGKNSSIIQAIPLGDGTKIRGSRFFTIVLDEFPHIPEEIFNLVIRPMGATSSDPMDRVRRLKQQKNLLERGLITQEQIDAESASTNQIVITSSGYFTFNHMYTLYCAYKNEMLRGNSKYAVFRVPYWHLPEGFLDLDNVEAAKREMSSLEFRMEYEAAFIPDTDSFYKASLLESCSRTNFPAQVAGTPGKSYCLGVDPARSEDSFAICVMEIGRPSKTVAAYEFQKVTFPKMSVIIEDLCDAFNVESIYMDSGGGGLAIKDILAENSRQHPLGPILDPEDEVHQRKTGRHILTMCNFTTEFISVSNYACLRLLEHRDLLFPSIDISENPNSQIEEAWDTIHRMKQQMQSIEMSETPTGKQHFDVPKGGGHGRQKKDLFTAFFLAGRCVYDMIWSEGLPDGILHHGGSVRDRENRTPTDALGVLSQSNPELAEQIRDKIEMIEDPDAYRARLMRGNHKRTLVTSAAAVLKPTSGKKKR